jgi:hypothetical protein
MDDEANDSDADAGIGDVKSGPGVRQRKVQVEKREIDHVTVKEPVRQVAHYSSEEESQGDITQPVAGTHPSQEERENEDESETGEDDEKRVLVLERTEGGAVIGHVDESEEIRNDELRRIVGVDVTKHQSLGDLIQEVEWEREKQDVFHAEIGHR